MVGSQHEGTGSVTPHEPNEYEFWRAVRTVRCPFCGADQGEMCVTKSSNRCQPHTDRTVRAIRLGVVTVAGGITPARQRVPWYRRG